MIVKDPQGREEAAVGSCLCLKRHVPSGELVVWEQVKAVRREVPCIAASAFVPKGSGVVCLAEG